MEYCISLLVNADNAIDVAHAKRCPLPFLSCMVDDCLKRGKSVQEGGAVYNFTGPQGFGIANMADSLFAVRKLVYEEKKVTMEEMKEALAWNFGKGLDQQSVSDTAEAVLRKMKDAGQKIDENTVSSILKAVMNAQPGEEKMKRYEEIHNMIEEVPKFGNDIPEVDYFARDVAYTYTKPLQNYKNPRGGQFQAGLYSCFCQCTSVDRPVQLRMEDMPTHRCRWSFSVRWKRCKRPYSSGYICFQTGSFYCIERNFI